MQDRHGLDERAVAQVDDVADRTVLGPARRHRGDVVDERGLSHRHQPMRRFHVGVSSREAADEAAREQARRLRRGAAAAGPVRQCFRRERAEMHRLFRLPRR